MKIAFLILAHQSPQQLFRFVKTLSHPNADCWIHLDVKADIQVFQSIFDTPGVFKVPQRVYARWGTFGSVQAMTNSLVAAMHSGKKYDYFQFLSGADYLVRPVAQFIAHLQQKPALIYIGNRPLEESQQNMVRFYRYHFPFLSFPLRRWMEGAANRLLPKRSFPGYSQIRKGSQWMTLPYEAVRFILEFMASRSAFKRYFQFVHVPDEFFFQTMLFNSKFRDKMVNGIHHYIDWTSSGRNPRILRIGDAEKIMQSEAFFARKFDLSTDRSIVDYIDLYRETV